MPRVVSYILIVLGGIVAIYAQAGESQNQMILIGGIVILMVGIYSLSRNIPSKNNDDQDDYNPPNLKL